MSSIRRDLTLHTLLGVLLLSLAGAVLMYGLFRSSIRREFDETLEASASTLGSIVTITPTGRVQFGDADIGQATIPNMLRQDGVEIWRADGMLVYRSPWLTATDVPRRLPRPNPAFHSFRAADGRQMRAVQMQILPAADDDLDRLPDPHPTHAVDPKNAVTLVLARDAHGMTRTLAVLLASLLAYVAAVGGSAVAVVAIVVRRGLRPLDRLARQAGGITADTLQSRFTLASPAAAELVPIVDRLNDLLARLQSAFETERQFVADVAHELRTPVAELRTVVEVALKWPRDGGPEAALRDTLQVAMQMESVVNTLLAVARSETATGPARRPVDLAAAVRAAVGMTRQSDRLTCRPIDLDAPRTAFVETEPGLLARILDNLLSNAAEYAAGDASIVVTLRPATTDGWTLTLRNAASGLTEADVGRLTQAFWRKDPSRSDRDHLGLGLTLVQRYCKLLSINFSLRLDGGDFVAELTFPPTASQAVTPGQPTLAVVA